LRETALHIAARSGEEEVVVAMLEQGFDANAKNIYGATPLHEAARAGHWKIACSLIKLGQADVNAIDNAGDTALRIAVKNQDHELVYWLFCWSANIHLGRGMIPSLLHLAARKGSAKIISLLIEAKADVNQCDADGKTALHVAAKNGQLEAVRVLLKKGADVDAMTLKGITPLHYAAKHGHKDVVIELLLNNASVNPKQTLNTPNVHIHREIRPVHLITNQPSPLHLAAKEGHAEIVKILAESGANINVYTHQTLFNSLPVQNILSKAWDRLNWCTDTGNMFKYSNYYHQYLKEQNKIAIAPICKTALEKHLERRNKDQIDDPSFWLEF
jgi:ankyrin repeat protein